MNVADLSRETAVEGGRIYAELMKKGEGIELNDCLIAATSLSLGIHEIVTRDTGHFNRITMTKLTIKVSEIRGKCPVYKKEKGDKS